MENKIYFFPPIFMKIGNLEPVEIKSLLVPLKKENKSKHNLLGLDILSELKTIIYKNEKYDQIEITLENV